MRISILFTFILVLLSSATFGQEKYSTLISLDWFETSFDNILDDKESINIQTFKNAAFDAKTPELARYLHHLPLPGKGKLNVTISPSKTSSINLSQDESISEITNEFKIITEITQEKNKFQGNISLTPIRKTIDGFEKLEEFRISVTFIPSTLESSLRGGNTFTSALSNGTIYKVPLKSSGVYEITGNFLSSVLGISDGSISSSSLQIFSNNGGRLPMFIDDERIDDLQEIPLFINDGGDGQINNDDKIRFYAEGADAWSYDAFDEKYEFDKN